MFHKPFHVKSKTTIKSSDRRKLRRDVQSFLPSLTDSDIASLFPNKGDVTCSKIIAGSSTPSTIYSTENKPLFFTADEKIYPSVYTLWLFPKLLHNFVTSTEVFKKLSSGADLMLPGVIVNGELTVHSLGQVQRNDCCSVSLPDNRAPVSVGVAFMSATEMISSGMRGKGIKILHCHEDYLWKLGDKSLPPLLVSSHEVYETACGPEKQDESIDKTDPAGVLEISSSDAGNEALTSGASEEYDTKLNDRIQTKEDIDQELLDLLLSALKIKTKDTDLPILTRTFYHNHMLACCPPDTNVDIRNSSYRKLSKFLKKIEKMDLITLMETAPGVDSICNINRQHERLLSHVPRWKPPKEIPIPDDHRPPVVTDLVSVSSELASLFKNYGFKKGQVVHAREIREAVTSYINNNSLQMSNSKCHISLDANLANVVLQKGENNLVDMAWENVMKRCLNKTQPMHQITFSNGGTVTRKGHIQPINLDIKQRGSNKKVTIVDNVHLYGLDPDELSQRLKHDIACSVSLSCGESKNAQPQIVVQGNQITTITRLLKDYYKIPMKYIQGTEKGVKLK